MRNLNNRKTRNILEFEIDKRIADTVKKIILLEILNFLSSQFSSFTNLIVRERFINPFFKLLNSPGKNAEVP
jgi:hypothetical protein